MRSKPWLVAVLGLALVGTCAVSVWTLYTGVAWLAAADMSLDVLRGRGRENTVEIVAHARYPFGGPVALTVETSAGDVDVRAGQGGAVEVRTIRRGWARTAAAAEAAARAVVVTVRPSTDALALAYEAPERERLLDTGPRVGVSFIVTVPRATTVTLTTGPGDLTLRGTRGAATLTAAFGEIEVADLEGTLAAESRTGEVILDGVHAGGGDVSASTAFGDVRATRVVGRDVTLGSRAGDVVAEDLVATGEALLESGFGGVGATSVRAGALSATSDNGAVEVRGGEVTGTLTAHSHFGDVDVGGVRAASYHLRSSNGSLTLSGPTGALDLDTGFGDIDVTGASDALLTLSSRNGRVAFAGHLSPRGSHSVRSDFGDIELSLPADSALDLELETGFGKIRSELPVTVRGDVEPRRWAGALNGGGARLVASTKNGQIVLTPLPASR